jgi:hypothetical protein
MKKISVLLLFVLVFQFISCDKSKNIEKEEIQQKKNIFTVEINAVINEKDVICLYYKDNSISFFNEEMAIYKNIEKSNVPQTIVFELPENFIPNDFRFDLSHVNPNQKMKINTINFSFKGEEFDINNIDLEKYFTNNEGVVFNETDRFFSFQKTKEGNYDPFLTTTGQFYPLLEKLVGIGAFQPPVNQ